jgi:hypothetical protein
VVFSLTLQGLDELLDSGSSSVGVSIHERARAACPRFRQWDRDQSGSGEARNDRAWNDPDAKAVRNRVFQTVETRHHDKHPCRSRGMIGGSHREQLQWLTSERDEPFGMESRQRQLGPRRKGVALRQ